MTMPLYMVELLRAALHGTCPGEPPEGIDWEKMYALADFHSVAPTVYYGILQLPEKQRPIPRVLSRFQKAMQITLGRESIQYFEVNHLMEELDQEGIAYLPLKGWLLKELYPRPDMRSMCDVDILISEQDMPKIAEIMKRCGFEMEMHGENHDGYMKSGTLSIEMHWQLFGETSPYYDYFREFMEKRTTSAKPGKMERKLSREDFYIHMIAHMAKHFRGGGTGVRSVLDVYEYQKAFGKELDYEYMNSELDQIGLRGFLYASEELARSWFETGEDIDRDRRSKMAMFILSAGTYGCKDFEIVAKIQHEDLSKAKYLLRRFFPGRKWLQVQYPCLEKAPVLLPFCWIARGCRSVFMRRNKMLHELRKIRDTDSDERDEMNEVWRDSGLLDE